MWTLVTDIPAPRKERLHHLLDHQDTLVWSGQNVDAGLAFAFIQGHTEIRLEGDDYRYVITLWPLFDGTPVPEPANDPGERAVDCLGPFTPTAIEPPHCQNPPGLCALDQTDAAASDLPETP